MNLSYSDEQNMLREQVLKFCESDYTFDVREKIVESNYGHNPETWKQFADLGLQIVSKFLDYDHSSIQQFFP